MSTTSTTSRLQGGMFTSRTDDWPTPLALFNRLNEEFGFTLDPCASKENAKCTRFFTKEENGLLQRWGGEVVFMNPPYGSEIGLWIRKAWQESRNGATVVCLIPSRTDTKYWHRYVMRATEIRFISGRVKFGNGKDSAPFPSAIVVFRPPLISSFEASPIISLFDRVA